MICHAGSSIQWGAWSSVGMAHGNTAVLASVEKSGLGVVAPARGLAALQAVLSGSASAQLVQVRWRRGEELALFSPVHVS